MKTLLISIFAIGIAVVILPTLVSHTLLRKSHSKRVLKSARRNVKWRTVEPTV